MRLEIHHKGNSLSNFYYSLSLYIISFLNTDSAVGGIFLGKNTRGGPFCRTRRGHVIIARSAVHQANVSPSFRLTSSSFFPKQKDWKRNIYGVQP